MGNPISPISGSNSSFTAPTAEAAVPLPQAKATPVTPIPAPAEDTVQVSAEARARLLSTQGLSVPEIANNLEVSTKVVVSYLGETQLEAAIAALQVK